MKIGLDVDSLTIKSGGIGRYAVNLINHVAKILLNEGQNEIFIFFHHSFDRDLIHKHSHLKFIDKYTNIKSNVLRKGIFLPFSMRRLKMDLFHGLDHIGIPFLYEDKRCKYVVTIHDLITRIYPSKFTKKHRLVQNTLLPHILRKADRIIAVSNSTKNDIIKFYPEYAHKIKVIYEGVESQFFPRSNHEIEKTLDKYNVDFRYILFLGTVEPRKNIIRVVDAFIQLKQEGNIEQKLIITGRKGWLYKDIIEKINKTPFSQDIIFTDFVDDEDLPSLYSGAEIFLYPSLYEGFGLPVLEAMSCGSPVITSNLSSLPEIAGDAAILVDPMNVEEIVQAMEKLLRDRELRKELKRKSLERAKFFSWEMAAKETLHLYEDILG
ncbi:MAG: glycosyltransferase family 4 protein [Candidatus Aminicenantes bacterium]|nr:glycosyltransferase family 4 protein [Candidatus Aminicenantes bacterium]